MQQITVAGRMSADAEVRQAGGNEVTSFNLAVDQGWGDKKVTNWFRVSIWGKKGSGAAPYLLKGSQITVVGELEIGTYNDKPQYNIRTSDFTMPAKQSGGASQHRNQDGMTNSNRSRNPQYSEDLNDELPPF